jgi:DNA transposition AAA+ family ATPase
MKRVFATTSNSIAFDEAIAALKKRGAREASWLLLCGEAGHGKSALVANYVLEEGGIYIRAKAHWTPAVTLSELVVETGQTPDRRNAANFDTVVRSLATNPRPIVVDEVDHILGKRDTLETIRDISDLTEVPIIVVGMEEAERRLKRFPQIYSRINQIVRTKPQKRDFVSGILADLCEVPFEDSVVDVVLAQTGGYLREILDAVTTVEAIGRRHGGTVTAAMVKSVSLIGGRTARVGR